MACDEGMNRTARIQDTQIPNQKFGWAKGICNMFAYFEHCVLSLHNVRALREICTHTHTHTK